MTQDNSINILVAEDNDVSREMIAGILRTQGFRVFGAIDGESAIKVVDDRAIDLALVDVNMAPKSGLEFIKYLVVKGLDVPVIIITGDDSSHILVEANALGVTRVIQKPINPDKLLHDVHKILKRRGFNPQPLAVATKETRFSPDDLIKKAIALADRNAKSRHGGPYGALVSDVEGRILGEGVNGITSRADPTAHAEVMAIRRAADKLGRADLSDCVLYCSSQPTMVGQALIASVGIAKVYYGLSHSDVGAVRERKVQTQPAYIQIGHDEALAMFKSWQGQKDKVAD